MGYLIASKRETPSLQDKNTIGKAPRALQRSKRMDTLLRHFFRQNFTRRHNVDNSIYLTPPNLLSCLFRPGPPEIS